MKVDYIIFLVLIAVFIALMFLPELKIDTNGVFLGKALMNRSWQYLILGACIFICGKNIIDTFHKSGK